MTAAALSCVEARRLVSDYLDGDVDQPTARRLERHLASCAWCPPIAAALRGVLEELGHLPEVPPDPSVLAAVTAAINNTKET
jgi:anti-sigma factor RsiW